MQVGRESIIINANNVSIILVVDGNEEIWKVYLLTLMGKN